MQEDPYDNDRVPPLHCTHRVFVTPVSLTMEARGKSPMVPRAVTAGFPECHDKTMLQASASAPALPSRPTTDLRAMAPPRSGALSQINDGSGQRCATGAHSATGVSIVRSATGISAARSAARTATSVHSRGSHATVASMRSKISEAVQREVERSALGDYLAYLQAGKDREREKRFKMPAHLRTGPSPVDHCCPRMMLTESLDASTRPVQMAVDPKWSTELKKMNDKAGQRIEYEQRLSGSVSGALIPELPHMQPKKHISNPPTPYFIPGQRRS